MKDKIKRLCGHYEELELNDFNSQSSKQLIGILCRSKCDNCMNELLKPIDEEYRTKGKI